MSQPSPKPFAPRRSVGFFRSLCVVSLFLFSFAAGRLFAWANSASICLTNAKQIRELDPETAGKNLPVRLRGVVTFYDAPLFNLFIQDNSAGIFVLLPHD